MSDYGKQRAMMAAHLLHNEARYILDMGDKFRIGIVAGHIGRILEGSRPVDAYVAALTRQDVARDDIDAAVADIAADRWPATSLVGRLLEMRKDVEEHAGARAACNGGERDARDHFLEGQHDALGTALSLLGVEVSQ